MNRLKLNVSQRLLGEFVKPYSKHILFALLCMAVAAAATSLFPLFLKPAFDYIFEHATDSNMIFLCVLILGSFIIKGIASYGESVIMMYVGQKIIFDVQKKMFDHLLYADLEFFHNIHSGELLSRFTNDVNMMRNAVSTTLVGIGRDFLTFIFLSALMFYRNPVLASFAFIVFPTAVVPISLLGRRMKKVTENTQSMLGVFSGYLTQIFSGIRIIRSYGSEKKESSRIQEKMNSLLKLILRSTKIRSSLHPISEIIGGLAIVLVLAYGGKQVIDETITSGDLISFLAALLMAYEPLKRITHLSANMQEGLASAKRVFDIIDMKPKIKNAKHPIKLQRNIESIELKNVCFSYRENHSTINDLSLKINKGQTVALVGQSGAGKSTLLNLIPRFYESTDGSITINGIDIKQIDLNSLYEQIAIVTQETILFDASFFDNIAYGKPDASKEEVINASTAALADEFITKSPNGYDTIIGENGIRISGGQRQRIAIARAILKNAPILLLDEATSALDSISEKSVQTALENLMKNRTTIVVAHRLSTIINSDLICLMEHGQIVEQGTHSELLAQKKLYYSLWLTQSG